MALEKDSGKIDAPTTTYDYYVEADEIRKLANTNAECDRLL
jgi:hypothetical protein